MEQKEWCKQQHPKKFTKNKMSGVGRKKTRCKKDGPKKKNPSQPIDSHTDSMPSGPKKNLSDSWAGN